MVRYIYFYITADDFTIRYSLFENKFLTEGRTRRQFVTTCHSEFNQAEIALECRMHSSAICIPRRTWFVLRVSQYGWIVDMT
ncbi:hypothetical protein CEXT_562851 [Caerostris extrusa]|uniref:Uncharacterized protein n=1 Tax=Caerostris extrusa TaxID=172846 RepID=A0AAV4VLJ0_CAEEX|nr:hypothetical protein CEXT_562851 [Caerostris extrusa]